MARQTGALQARVEYAGLSAAVAAMRAVPRERALELGARLGAAAAAVDRPNRRIALINLRIAFPELDRSAQLKIIRDMYRNWGRMLAEWVHMDSLDRSNIERYVTYDGQEHWDEAARVSNGRGILVLTAHYGNWELLNAAHAIYGTRITIVHRPLRNPLMDRDLRAMRSRFGNPSIERKAAGLDMARLLRQNWMIAVALDLDVRQGVFVDLFGKPASTSDGLARLAMASGAPVVPCFMVRDGHSACHRITISPALEIEKGRGDRESAIVRNTQRCARAIEDAIRGHPDHWNWIHRRWKTRPPGEPRFY